RRSDAADLSDQLRKPEASVRTERDPARETPRRRDVKLRQLAAAGDASDPVPMLLGKPHTPVRSRDDVNRRASGNRKRELRHRLTARRSRHGPERARQDQSGKATVASPEAPT